MIGIKARSAADCFPEKNNYESLKAAAETCHGCDLYKLATQTVFGEGPKNSKIILVVEQPGDKEDKHGHSFVGPAGRLWIKTHNRNSTSFARRILKLGMINTLRLSQI